MLINKRNLSFLIFCLCVNLIFAQELTKEEQIAIHLQNTGKHNCATGDLSKEANAAFLKEPKAKLKTVGYTQLPVRIHIVTLDNGTGGISLNNINRAMANLNFVYQQEDIEFYIANVNYIASTAYYEFSQSEEDAMCGANEVDDAVNVFFVNNITTNSGGGACGYARYPQNLDITLRILMDNGCTLNGVNGTFVHEFGHFFNLAHTHNGTSNGNGHANAEHVPRTGGNSNCSTNGDYLCDTEADPTGSTTACVYDEGGSDTYGNLYTPDEDNIMSYYPDGCGGIFTPNQYTRIGVGLATRLAHTAYDLDGAQPLANANPTGLTGTVFGTVVTLNWNDNASNEYGYLIERSDDGGSTYSPVPFGGVAPNITTFSDGNLLPMTTYSFKVKASSDNPNDYSNVITITTDNSNFICADAQTLTSCGSFTAPDPNQGNGANNANATHAVWYKFISPYTGTVDIFSCLGGADTRLWVYSGTCGGLTLIANNDDECEMTPGSNTYASEVLAVPVTKNIPIYIEWDDRWNPSSFTFQIVLNDITDACAQATNITTAGSTTVPSVSCGSGASQSGATHAAWYKFIPPTTGNITVRSCNQSVNTRLYVHTGSCGSLTLAYSSDDDCSAGGSLGNVASIISNIPVVASTPIYIEWDDRWSTSGFDFDIIYQGNCPTDYTLSGTQSISEDFETDGVIASSQTIQTGVMVDYDSGMSITLEANFEVIVGAIFNAIIDGCGGSQ